MTVLEVAKWVVKPEKQEEHNQLWQKFQKTIEDNPETFKELKSLKLYTQEFGGIYGSIVELAEFDSLADREEMVTRLYQNEEFTKLYSGFTLLIDPSTYSVSILRLRTEVN